MEKSNFDRLIQRYLEGDVTEQERIKIEAWLDVMKTKQGDEDVVSLSAEEEDALFKKIIATVDNVDEVIAMVPNEIEDRRSPALHDSRNASGSRRYLLIAAALVLLLVVSIVAWRAMDKPATGNVLSSQIEKVMLNDGTLVWLRKGSTLTYYENPGTGIRHATLNGEALFEVTKDPDHPFTIACGTITVKVLGTSFSLKTQSTEIDLKVLTGKVSLSSMTDVDGIIVGAHQRITYKGTGAQRALPLSEADISHVTENTEYDMTFSNTEMKEVIRRFEKKFEVSVSLKNQDVNQCRITADFTDHSMESTLRMLSDLLELTYKIEGKTVAIAGAGCKH